MNIPSFCREPVYSRIELGRRVYPWKHPINGMCLRTEIQSQEGKMKWRPITMYSLKLQQVKTDLKLSATTHPNPLAASQTAQPETKCGPYRP